jgi:hypothetical protein
MKTRFAALSARPGLFPTLFLLERVLKISRAVLRRGGAAGVVAPQSKIHEGYSPSSRLAIHPGALAIPFPIYFQNTLLLLFFFLAPATAKGQLTYITNDGSILITGYHEATGDEEPVGVVIIPATTNGLPVTGVSQGAFQRSSLTSVTVPGSITDIGEGAFEECANLTNVVISNGVTLIGSSVFYECFNLPSITIPGSVKSIGEDAFEECANLTNVVLSNGVTLIGSSAFFNCSNLPSITIPGTVNSIGSVAFEGCYSLTNVSILEGVTNIGFGAFQYCTKLTNVTIPASVSSIGESAFANCDNLTGAFFQGNAPASIDESFSDDSKATFYYLPGTEGWSSELQGIKNILWNPLIDTSGGNVGVISNQFVFKITGTTNIPIVVEACSNLANSVWTPLQSLTLTNGSYYFSEPLPSNDSARFYRISSP